MKVIPSIDLKDGKSVKLVKGVPGTGIEVSDDPLKLAAYWEGQGAEILHVVDLDAAIENKRTSRDIIGRIIENVSIPVEVGGGIRSKKDALELVDAGARWIITGTEAIRNPEFVARLLDSIPPEKLIIALDAKSGRVVTHGWVVETSLTVAEAIGRFDRFRPAAYLCTNVSVEGTMTGVETEEMKRIVDSTETLIIYSGGVSSLSDLASLKGAGVYATVIGMALYKGVFTLRKAQEVASDA